ncbi:spore germination protein [Marinisporobacter balticus]|uniref:Spore germination protein KA n=1 Tax=Marinisporobacter balticus TaxID=2018667 RepID=A0A4R2KUZ0_9FIRM|nr:spore germination protein [Marinisporobacter balticus]TCO74969.1 spore germination protein KA [Marinisporobacter balticus]
MFKILKDKVLGKNDIKILGHSQDIKLTKSLEKNIELFKKIFNPNETIIFRKIESRQWKDLKCCMIFVDGMVDKTNIHENMILPIMNSSNLQKNLKENILDILVNKIINASDVKKQKNVNGLITAILSGNTVVLVEGVNEALTIDTKKWEQRGITEPVAEQVVRGPREAFTETIMLNLTLIRRKILSPDLKFQFKEIGARTQTKVCVCYIEGLANKKIIKEVNKRLDDIEIDAILESGYIEELIKDAPLSPFATIGNTERPDIVAANLLEGRIAIVVDGTPFVLTLPYLFIEYFQSNEDYYNNFIYSSISRLLRIFSFFLTTSVPAVYVALVTFHQEMIPTPLILSISAAREGVPFPTIVEALLMFLAFEIIREGGVRLPAPIGSTIGFVGAIILGQAAVEARFVSSPIVIVTALAGITMFLTPKMIGPVIIMRFIFLLLSAFLGLYGYIFGVIGLFIHLMAIRSFGIPYMINIGDLKMQDIKDTAIRAPWWYMYYRPKLIGAKDPVRKKNAKIPEKR